MTTMIDISLADGDIEDSELDVIKSVLEEIIGSKIARSELRELALSRQSKALAEIVSPFEATLKNLSSEKEALDDNGREIIFESVFRVACADGEVESEEYKMLLKIAQALGIYDGIVDLEINRFKRKQAI